MQKTKTSADVYRNLIETIRSGHISPGERFSNERDLADLYSTSRPIVRDALLLLQNEGYIERKVGSGTYLSAKAPQLIEKKDAQVDITTPHEHDFRETLEARLLFEPGAATLAARHVKPDHLDLMEDCLTRILMANDWLIYKEEIYNFTRCIYVAAGNDILLRTFDWIIMARQKYKFDGKREKEPVAKIVRQYTHDQLFFIYKAIKDGNGQKAKVEVERNLLGMVASNNL